MAQQQVYQIQLMDSDPTTNKETPVYPVNTAQDVMVEAVDDSGSLTLPGNGGPAETLARALTNIRKYLSNLSTIALQSRGVSSDPSDNSEVNLATTQAVASVKSTADQVASDLAALSSTVGTPVPTNHATDATTYGAGSATNYGHVKLSDTYSSATQDADAAHGVAASQNAVAGAYSALDSAKAPTDHASAATTYGAGSTTNYGHTKLSDTYSVAETNADAAHAIAASQKAVADAYDAMVQANQAINQALAGKAPANHASSETTYGVGTSSNYGHLKITDDRTTADASANAAAGMAASMYALKAAEAALQANIDGKLSTSHSNVKGTASQFGHVELTDAYTLADGETAGTAAQSIGASQKAVIDSHANLSNSISTLQNDVSSLNTDMASLESRVSTAETNISNISSGGGGSAFNVPNLKWFNVFPSASGTVRIRFSDPNDLVIGGDTVAAWDGTRIVMNENHYPENENDGVTILNNTVRDGYKSTWFVKTGLTDNKTYYFQAFPYSDTGVFTRSTRNRASCYVKAPTVLGFKIAKATSGPSARITYTDDNEQATPAAVNLSSGVFNYGDWGNEWFITDNKPLMITNDGIIDYYLNPSNYAYKEDGTTSDVANISYEGNAFSQIPLTWIKSWEDSTYEYCQISDAVVDNDFLADPFTREDGSVADYVYLACFDGYVYNGKLRSIKGVGPTTSTTTPAEIGYAQANNTSLAFYTRTFSQRNLINMLLFLMGKTDDGQTAFGYGFYTGQSQNEFLTVGLGSDKGQFYGTNANKNVVKVFHIENWWGNTWERIAGMMYVGGTLRIKTKYPYNTTAEGYINTGISFGGTSGGYISGTRMASYGRVPVTASGSQSTYTCDGLWWNASQTDYAFVGHHGGAGFLCGPSCVILVLAVSSSDWAVGSALSLLL